MVTICSNLDNLLKGNLSSSTKTKDKSLTRTQALLQDASGPLKFLLEELSKDSPSQEVTKEAVQTVLEMLGNITTYPQREEAFWQT